MKGLHVLLSLCFLVILIQTCICLTGVSVPIKHIAPPVYIVRKRAFGTDGIVPGYQYSGGSWAVGLKLGATSSTLYCNFDTGSFDLFVAGSSCSNCEPTPPAYYTPSSNVQSVGCGSTTCNTARNSRNSCNSQNQCQTRVVYGDESGVVASIVRDVFGLPGLTQQILGYYGSITSTFNGNNGQTTFLSEGQSGLIGSAYATGSSFPNGGNFNLWDYLANVNNLPNIFSLCINKATPWMSFGENFFGNPNFWWTAVANKPYWGLVLTDILLNYNSATANGGGTSLGLSNQNLNKGRPFIDSGTTLLYLETTIFDTLFNALLAGCSNGRRLKGICGESQDSSIFNNPFTLTALDIQAYPTIQFAIPCVSSGNRCSTLNVPAANWLRKADNVGNYIAGIVDGSGSTILGDVFMFSYHVVFDKTRDYMGFGLQSTCSLSYGVITNVTNPSNPNAGSRLSSGFISALKEVL